MFRDPSELALTTATGDPVAVQVAELERWSDGSLRWVLLDWLAWIPEGENGFAQWLVHRRTSPDERETPSAWAELKSRADRVASQVRITDSLGRVRSLAHTGGTEIDSGPVRWSFRYLCSVEAVGPDVLPLRVRIDVHLFADRPVARVHLTLHNPDPADHPGGLWDLGNGGSIFVEDVSFRLASTGEFRGIDYSSEPDIGWSHTAQPVTVDQPSSGGENWQSSNHIDKDRTVSLRFRGYRQNVGDKRIEGLRATPIVAVRSTRETIAVCLPYFWQNFPKVLTADSEGIVLKLFPGESGYPHEIQGGEMKTHVFWVAFDTDHITDMPLAWARRPSIPVIDPEWVARSEAVPYLTPTTRDPDSPYQKLADLAIVGEDTFEAKREVIDEYGWRHFGDIYGDHEALLYPGATPLVSHYNNQYDPVSGFARQFLRSGDVRWFRAMQELAYHVIDIDIYNTSGDKAAYNRGLFWHTYHYVDADTGTHRTYPKRGRIPPKGVPVPGGGPANEQNYAHGLLETWLLTGEPLARDAALGLAQWVIDMDDGSKTVFRWLSRGSTGNASSSRTPDYHGPGRGAANSILSLLDGFRLTRDRKYLDKAEELVRRCVHPSDDPTAMDLLDAENRWFYTMFLQALGRYLDQKCEMGELDAMYAYAREVLLHYARWMASHEYPYLSRPEKLEYPTETWAAQDVRKCEIFDLAALHASEEDRARFVERAEFFHRTSMETLSAMATKSLCRPVVLLLSYGWSRVWHRDNPRASRPAPANSPTVRGRVRFVPQKAKAMRRAKNLAVAGTCAAGILVAVVVWLKVTGG